ncbi:RNA polymerase sigma-70 factor (ECF subfamily) [Flavobacterium sp. CG_23.5]|uniref:sigma-70 family RNA polymerase sigma factor n=1 Tax=unclassified Flavobacterium TaxID=196869 RepID=UPI0018CA0FC4|nr:MULTISPECIES: sigma-70 family RNA polymerase sigma factor [unclassified Flavobacterium]MBG6109712.1 RNA polymerase sigma-70 factor (ECF subfamily) [Flavobacterium sp. CG_9.10]MBP2284746.1 RNA polymerase sigma-70 factor (ECF subfamily) [Flavobacterium sp. CG_23.5]
MDLIKENSKSVLEQWVNQFSDELYSWAFFKTSSKEVAEDLVQDTFLAAFHKIDSFQGKSQPKTWLFSILNNKVIDYYRLTARTTKKNFSLTENSGYEISDGLFNKYGCWKTNDINAVWEQEEELLDNPDFNSVMEACMEDLPQKWKLAVTSKYLSEKKTETICQELEITASNYWQIVHRSKLLLKKCLELKWV